jgi:hypothetical protein
MRMQGCTVVGVIQLALPLYVSNIVSMRPTSTGGASLCPAPAKYSPGFSQNAFSADSIFHPCFRKQTAATSCSRSGGDIRHYPDGANDGCREAWVGACSIGNMSAGLRREEEVKGLHLVRIRKVGKLAAELHLLCRQI